MPGRLIILSLTVWLTAGSMTRTMRGFTIRLHRTDAEKYTDEYHDTWAEKGTLPVEWNQVTQDPTVERAQIYTSAQRHVRGNKRKFIDQYPQTG
jgi:hypothetical protein